MATHDCPLVHCHAMHQKLQSHHDIIYSTASIHLQESLQLETRVFCVQECSLPIIKSALSFTAVAYREISSTAALMKLLLPIEIHVAVCDLLQSTLIPTIAGLLPQNCVIIQLEVSLLRGLWNSGAAPADVHRGAAIISFGKQYSR